MAALSKNYLKSQIACTVFAAIVLVLILVFPSPRMPYLFGGVAFAITSLIFSGIYFVLNFIFRKHSVAYVFGLLSFASFGYAVMEAFYAFVPIKLGIATSCVATQHFFSQVDLYVIDRSYQYIAIGVLFIGLWFAIGSEVLKVLRFGDLSVETKILGEATPMSWKRVLLRLLFMLTALTLMGLAIRPTLQISSGHLFLFSALLIGGFNNSLIEELVFRGLLQPAFELQLSPKTANIVQAIIFSVVHFSYVGDATWNPVIWESVRLILYVGIGMFFGRATNETKGIGVSTILHFLITSAIWANLTFSKPL